MLILAGVAVNQRSQWARWIGILAGAILAISATVWSLVYILIGNFVIYGLTAHGGRSRTSVNQP